MNPDAETQAAAPAAAGWTGEIDEILGGDHVVMLAYVTPAKGVVLMPLSNFAIRDREAGWISVNSSVGVWRKLERMRQNPSVAVAFHTREHATTGRPEYVLVQGRAEVGPPVADYPSTVIDNWERIEPWRDLNRFWKWWERVYALRIEVRIHAERIVVWPDLECRGTPVVHGAPQPPPPEPQRPPSKGTGPRMDHARAAMLAAKLPDSLLGWVGGDGLPVVVPVRVGATEPDGIQLDAADGLVPSGGRRAGFAAHWFSKGVVGQNQRKHTGWLQAGTDGRVAYAPHTTSAYRFPASQFLFRVVSGGFTRRGYRSARKAGIV
jgi:nitroimidazol reductase NimA-like FMN-containing flavoprotein (pyridoxamine 5'-phosphate oxidase superfamily)